MKPRCDSWQYGSCDLPRDHRGLHFIRYSNGAYSWWGVIEL